MTDNVEPRKKEKKPPTERQAFNAWLLSMMIVGIGVGIAICGLNGIVSNATGDAPPGPVEFLVVGGLVVFVGALLARSVPKTLKVWDRFAKDRTAVSPVIAVVLMVAITVVLAAVVFVLVSDIGSVDEPAPRIGFGKDGSDLLVTKVEGVVLWGDLDVSGCATVPPEGDTVDAGDVASDCAGTVTVVHEPTNSLIYRSEF